MFESTSDKVWRVLTANAGKTVGEKISAIKASVTSLSDAEINSVLAELSKEELIATLYGSDGLIDMSRAMACTFELAP